MRPAKLFSVLVITALSVYASAGFYLLPLGNFEGDLTRMGKLPESKFGWTKPQPAIDPALLAQSPWQEAEVLVVGDSFSRPHLWQTILTREGFKVRTIDWGSVRSVCADFDSWLKAQHFHGRYLVLELVERGAEGALDRSARCDKMSYRTDSSPPPLPPEVLPNRESRSYTGKLSVGIQTWLHSVEYTYLAGNPDFNEWTLPNHVQMKRLADGCTLFSHPHCQDVLFLQEDRVQDFDETMLQNMGAINSRLKDYELIWAIVPDKSTAYINSDKQFWNRIEERFGSPNLLQVFRQAIREKTLDLYRGNDTHLSTGGFLLMGESILNSMKTAPVERDPLHAEGGNRYTSPSVAKRHVKMPARETRMGEESMPRN